MAFTVGAACAYDRCAVRGVNDRSGAVSRKAPSELRCSRSSPTGGPVTRKDCGRVHHDTCQP